MKHQGGKKPSRVQRGLAITTTIAAAAGLVGAAILYLKKRGVDTDAGARTLKKRARSLGAILSGESRQAYADIRKIIVSELVAQEDPVTKARVRATIRKALTALKERKSLTAAELRALGDQLQSDWKQLKGEAERRS